MIVGGGFGGLYTAKALRRAPVKVTLVDRRNFHLFQPLLYQVATGGLFAWLLWLFVHIYYLIGFENKLLVMFQWGWNYFTRKRGAQLITGKDPFPSSSPGRAQL